MPSTYTFPNGLQLVYQPSNHSIPISNIYIFCKVGSAYETDSIRGASHFVEHMCFKGTEKVRRVRNLLIQYNTIGSYSNAYTTNQHTCYYIKCDNKFFDKSYNILVDLLLHSTFPKSEFIKEQNVIIEENIRNQDNSMNLITERIESLYYKGSSYEYPVDSIKYHQSPKHLKYTDVYNFYKWFYIPSNMIISIVSNIPFSDIKDIISKSEMSVNIVKLNKIPSFILSTPNLNLTPNTFSIDYYHKKGIKVTTISVGFRTCDHLSKDKYPLTILQSVLNNFSGRLFTEFRTKHGLTYQSKCIMDNHEHTGHFTIILQTNPEMIIKVLSILVNLINDIKKGISYDELHHSKIIIKNKFLRSMELNDIFAKYNGIECIYGSNIIPYQELYPRKFARITKKQVDDVIDKYFQKENMVVCILYDKEINKKKIDEQFNELF